MLKNLVKRSRRFIAVMSVLLVVTSMVTPIQSKAAQVVNKGNSYLGYFTFKNTNTGASRTMNGSRMKLAIAWKQADTWTPVNLKIKVIRTYTGTVAYAGTLKFDDDKDGKDSDGFYYLHTPYFNINYGSDYHIFYDVVTAPGYPGLPLGDYRSASVHTWVYLE